MGGRVKVVWTILGAGQEKVDPRAAGRVAEGTGCRKQEEEVGSVQK